MMLKYYIFFLIFGRYVAKCSDINVWASAVNEMKLKTFMFWPNATVPFYIHPDHFADDQAVVIRKSLAMVAFKTCVRFAPVLAAPTADQHVLVFVNPEGLKRCKIEMHQELGHSSDKPHDVILGYECLKSPDIDMIVLRALGLPFEHTRMSRDLYVTVKMQNIEPHYIGLFTKDSILPEKLAAIKYDRNSIMHFGERDYSKNGHRTIVFKDSKFTQNRKGLTPSDILKVNLIYGPECQQRDRAEKVAICRSYPGVSRRKREIIEPPANRSLRVNPDITPPPHILAGITEPQEVVKQPVLTGEEDSLNILGIEKEADNIVELVYKLSALALKNANEKYCNKTSNNTSKFYYENTENQNKATDVLGVLRIIADFAKTIVDDTVRNLKEFCQNSDTIKDYQKQCKEDNDRRCPKTIKTDCLSPEYILERVEKAQDRAKKTNDDVTTTQKPRRRRKREAKTPKPKSEDKDKELKKESQKENLTDAAKVIKEERLQEIQKGESISKSSLLSSKTSSTVKDGKDEPPRRKFSDKRYRVKDRNDDSDWDESDVSLDKKNLEPEKTLKNKELLQKVLAEGASAILKKEKEAIGVKEKGKSSESTDESTDTDENGEDSEKATSKELYKKNEKVLLEEIDVDMDDDPRPKYSQRTQKTGPVPKTVELSKLNNDFYRERKWPDGDVIYVIEKLEQFDLVDLRKRLAEVNAILLEKTCVQLREVDAREAPGFDDYILLDHSPDYVTGRVGGKQNFGCIELFEGGQHKQHTAMVVMAMLGFYFEVARHDRDKHIRVHNRHIRADKLHHFEKLHEEVTLNIPYDFKSATHPSWQFWRKVGKKGISTVATYKEQDPDGTIMRSLGQNPELLSDSDILKINSVYGVECFQSNRASSKDLEEAERLNEEKVIQ